MERNIDIMLRLQTNQAKANADAFKKSTLGLSVSMTGLLSAVELASRAFQALGRAYSGTVGSAVELQNAVAEVTTLVGNQVGVQEQLENQVLDLQKAYGGEQTTIAKAFYDAISSGAVDASDAVGLLDTANKLAVGGVTDVNTAVNGLTTVLNSYGLGSEKAVNVSDALFAAMKAGKTTVGELSGSLGQVAPTAAALGVNFDELLASVSALTTGGVQTSVAATQIRATFSNLAKPTEALQKAFKEAGIASIDLALQNDGLVETLKRVVSTTDGTSSSVQSLFGSVEAGSAVLALTSDTIGGKFNETLKQMKVDAENAGQATEDAFAKIAEKTDFQLKQLGGQVSAFGTELGKAFLPAFNAILSGLTSLAKSLADFFSNNRELVRNFAESLGSAVISVIQALTAFANVISNNIELITAVGAGVASAATAFGIYSAAAGVASGATGILAGAFTLLKGAVLFLTGPVGLVITAIGLLTTGVILAYQNFDTLSAFATQLAADVLKGIAPAIKFLIDVFTGLRQAVNVGIAGFKLYYASLLDIAVGIGSSILPAFTTLLDAIGSVAGVFSSDLEQSIKGAKDSIVSFSSSLQNKIDKVKEDSKEMIKNGGVTEEIKAQNESLKKSYDDTVASVESVAQAGKELIASKEQEVVIGQKVEKEVKKEEKSKESLEKQTQDLTKTQKLSVGATKESGKAFQETSKKADEYKKKLSDLEKEVTGLSDKSENLEIAFQLIDEEQELKNIATVLGKQKTATQVSEVLRLQSVGKVKEAELELSKLKAEYEVAAVNKAEEERIKSIELTEETRLDKVRETNQAMIKAEQERFNKQRALEEKQYQRTLSNIEGIKASYLNIEGSLLASFQNVFSILPKEIQGVFSLLDFGVEIGKDIISSVGASLSETASLITGALDLETMFPGVDIAEKINNTFGAEIGSISTKFVSVVAEGVSRSADLFSKVIISSMDFFTQGLAVAGGSLIDAGTNVVTAVTSLPSSLAKSAEEFVDALDISALDSSFEKAFQGIDAIIIGLVDSAPKIIDSLVTNLPTLFDKISKALPEIIQTLTNAIPVIVPVLVDGFVRAFKAIIPEIPGMVKAIVNELPTIINGLLEIIPALIDELPKIIKFLVKAIPGIIRTVVRHLPTIIRSIVRAIPQIINAVVNNLPAIILALVDAIPVVMTEVAKATPVIIRGLIDNLPTLISEIIKNLPEIIISLAGGIIESMPAIVGSFFEIFIPGVTKVFTDVVKKFTELFTWIENLFNSIVSSIENVFIFIDESILQPMFGEDGVIQTVFRWVKENIFMPIIDGFNAAWQAVKDAFSWVKRNVFDPVVDAFEAVVGFFQDIVDSIKEAIDSAVSFVSKPVESVGGFLEDPLGAIGNVVSDAGDWLGFAKGGLIEGYPSNSTDSRNNDTVPAMLSPGEMVIPRSAVRDGLSGIMQFANETLGGKAQMLATGGIVSGVRPDYRAIASNSLSGVNLLTAELSSLRNEISRMGFAIARNGAKIENILEQWNGEGMPSDRGY